MPGLFQLQAERAITNLRSFLSRLERLDDAHLRLPSYNTEPTWSHDANRARRFHDYATAVLAAGGNAAGFGAAQAIYLLRFAQAPAFLYGAAALALVSLVVLIVTSRWSYRPE